MNKKLNIELDKIVTEVNKITTEPLNPEILIEKYKNTFLESTETLETSHFAKFIASEKESYTINRESSTVTFNENFFASAVLFTPEEKGTFELNYINLFGIKKQKIVDILDDQGRVIFWINDCIKQFSIKFNNEKIFSRKKIKISNFKVWGLEFAEAIHQINKLNKILDDRSNYEAKIKSLKDNINEEFSNAQLKIDEYDQFLEDNKEYEITLLGNITNLKNEKSTLQKNIDQQNIDIESLKSQISAKETQISKLEDDFNELSKRSSLLSDGNKRLEERQKDLEKRVNLFPDTLEGFIQRANKTKTTYGLLASVPLVILILLLNLSWDTLKKFTESTTLTSFESAWIVLIQRIPFTLLVITLASMCIAFLYKMVRHLTEVQQQELNLAKISMLAKDVADSEYSKLDEAALQKIRADKKIKLIREFFNSEFNRYQQFIEKEKPPTTTFSFIDTVPFKDIPLLNKFISDKN